MAAPSPPVFPSSSPKPVCTLLQMIYDYTTRYRMDMPLTTIKTYLLNSFIKDSLTISNFGKNTVTVNPCNLNIGCLTNDEPCNTDIITENPCTLRVTGFALVWTSEFYTLTPVITGGTAPYTYEWIDFVPTVLQLIGSVPTDPIINLQWVHPYPYNSLVEIVLEVTDADGCTAGLATLVKLSGNNPATAVLDATYPTSCGSFPTTLLSSLTDTSFHIGIISPDLYTYDYEIKETISGTPVDTIYGIGPFPHIQTALTPNTEYTVTLTKYCATGGITTQDIFITTLP